MNENHSAPTEFLTLVELLRWRALAQPDRRAYTFLADGETQEIHLTYGELDRRARAIGAWLQNQGATGKRVLLLYSAGLEYIAAFLGCLYAEAIAVPSYPPRLNRPDPRLQAIVADAQATLALTTAGILSSLERRFARMPDLAALRWMATDSLADALAEEWRDPQVTGDTLAFLQYTSGSTATPKGVMVSHGNILRNERMIQQAFGQTEQSTVVGWLPIYHDMGLIGNVLQPLYVGAYCILMSPLDFLQRPLCWLKAISRYQGRTSGGPNFAYDLCVHKITPEQRATLDLSSWEVAFSGAEPIHPQTLEQFAATFEPCGFRREAFYPCYGLAEATLFVSGGLKSALPVLYSVQGSALEQNRVAAAADEDKGGRTLVGCGRTWSGQEIVIADPESGVQCPPDQVGEIWISGANIAQGYWNRPEETQHTFQAYLSDAGKGPFLRTGDLGFLRDGELFVTGRIKDLIIIRGRNHYPQDIELTVEQSHPALRPGCGAAFSVESAGEERLVVVQELKREHRTADIDSVAQAVRQAVAEEHELQVHALALIKPGSLPKTSSGKIQRRACRARFLEGSLEAIGTSTLDEAASAPQAALWTRDELLQALAAREPQQRPPLLERHLQQQVAHLLKVSPSYVDPQQPLSALGLDSLAATELQHCLQADLGLLLPVTTILQGPSVAQLAAWALDQLAGATSPSLPLASIREEPGLAERAEAIPEAPLAGQTLEPIRKPDRSARPDRFEASFSDKFLPIQLVSRDGPLPLSFAQQRLWLLDQLEPGNPLYNIPVVVRLTGPLNVAALAKSLNKIVRRHESLRTRFTVLEGQPVQVISPELSLTLPVVDLGEWPETAREAEVQRLIAQAAQRSFDLAQAPLLRVILLRLGESEHVFLLAAHHIVSDGWSLGVLGQEISALYAAFASGRPSPLAQLPIQYADFACWQRQGFREENLATAITYWKEKLEGAPPLLEFPADHPRPPVQTFRGDRQCVRLSAALTQALLDLSRRERATLFMTLLAAFKVLLHRYTGQDDIVVGAPIAGRNRVEVKGLVGIFLNSLVLRTGLAGNPTFRELLARVRQTTLDAYAHQDLPFEKLLEALRPKRDPSRTPLFQVFINLLDFPNNGLELPGLTAQVVPAPVVGSNFDLTLYITPQAETIQLELVYNSDLFERERMGETLAQFEYLLEQVAANPEERISHFSLITPAARACLPDPVQVLRSGWEGAISTRFSERVHGSPEHPAVVDAYGTWRYQDLEARSNQLAHYLRADGIQSQDVVAIYGHRSAALVWALLGILKAGASFMILDPAYPVARLMDCVSVAQPRGWIQLEAAGQPPNALMEWAATLPCRIDLPRSATTAPASPLQGYSADVPGITPAPDDLAYVVFTSGSTGKPKGILGTHRPLSHFLHWHCKTFGLDQSDRFSMFSGLAHDPLLRDTLTPLWLGATLCIPEPQDMLSPDRLVDWMKREEISVADMTPAMGQLVAEATQATRTTGERVVIPSLRYIFFGGDVLTRRDVDRLRELAPSAACVNFYGTTETPQAMGYFVIPRLQGAARNVLSDGQWKASVPLGQGIEGVQLLVLNASQRLAGVGEVGEIYVRTPYLTKGYIGDDALTQERFILNPFTQASGDRLYRTGDLGRYLPDGGPGGCVEFLGRNDHQVKIRGFRIELEEIEAVLSQHSTVRQGVVLAQDVECASGDIIPGGDKQLAAYVLPAPGQTPTASALRHFMQEKLPEHMVPSIWIILDALPLTPNGKVDRRALPRPEGPGPELAAAYRAPQTRMEQTLAAIWQEALHVEQVGIHDNFFDLGGHSLLLAWVRNKLQAALDRDISMVKLFQYPTISALAEYLSQQPGKQPSPQPSQERVQTRVEAMRQARQLRQQYRAKERAG